MHRVEVTGDIRTLRFPDSCAHCGAPPAGTLPLSKMFRRTHSRSNRRTEYLFGFASVPFCHACMAAHEAARRPPDPIVLRRLRNRWLLASLPYLLPIVVLVWLASRLAPQAIRTVASRAMPDLLIWGGILVVIAIGVWGLVKQVLAGRRTLIADYDRGPDDLYPENPNVAAGFAAVNADRIWDPDSPRAVRTRWANYVLLALFMAFGLFMLARDMMGR